MSLFDNDLKNTNKENIKVLVVDFENFSDEEKLFIKKNLVEICYGKDSSYSPRIVAKKLLKFFSKAAERTKKGAIAEFFQTMIIRNQGFAQNHCYRNLEEGSIKKGFDGLFLKNGSTWIMESKSSYKLTSHRNKHKGTIDKAYNGIDKMLKGESDNDPWENAAKHSKVFGSSKSLVKKLEQLSSDYFDEHYQKIEDTNILIGSTIISVEISGIEKDITSLENYIITHNAQNEIIVALNLSTIELFINLLEEIANE